MLVSRARQNDQLGNHAVFKRRAEAVAILAGERRAPGMSKTKPKVRKTGTAPEEALVTILLKARRDRYPCDWLVAARLCRTHHAYEREVMLLEEYLSGERVPGRSWLELEERLFKLRAMLTD